MTHLSHAGAFSIASAAPEWINPALAWSVLVAVLGCGLTFLLASFRLGRKTREIEDKIETVELLDRVVFGDRKEQNDSKIKMGLSDRVKTLESATANDDRQRTEIGKLLRPLRRVLRVKGNSGEHEIEEEIRAALADIARAERQTSERSASMPKWPVDQNVTSSTLTDDDIASTDPQVPRPRGSEPRQARAPHAPVDRRYQSSALQPLTAIPPALPHTKPALTRPLPHGTRHTGGMPLYRPPSKPDGESGGGGSGDEGG